MNITNEKLFDILLDRLPFNVFWKNKEGVYMGCNHNFAKSVKFTAIKEVVGKTDYDFPVSKASSKKFRRDDHHIISTGKPKLNIEEEQVLNDGNKIWLMTSKIPLFSDFGEVVGVFGIYTNITALKEAQQKASSAEKAKNLFLDNMKHDFRVPFSGILSLAEVLYNMEYNPEKKELLKHVLDSSKSLLNQVNQIFDFIKLEQGYVPILDKKFALRSSIQQVVDMMMPAVKNKILVRKSNLDLNIIITEDVPSWVIGDEFRSSRILINLLANAVKFTEKGEISIEVSVAKKSKREIVLCYVIADTGLGIPKDQQDLIFERFNRVTASYSGVYEGKGLGLREVKKFCDELQGEIELESTLGKGSTFRILLPYRLLLLALE